MIILDCWCVSPTHSRRWCSAPDVGLHELSPQDCRPLHSCTESKMWKVLTRFSNGKSPEDPPHCHNPPNPQILFSGWLLHRGETFFLFWSLLSFFLLFLSLFFYLHYFHFASPLDFLEEGNSLCVIKRFISSKSDDAQGLPQGMILNDADAVYFQDSPLDGCPNFTMLWRNLTYTESASNFLK